MRNLIYYITVVLFCFGLNESLAQIKCQPLITHASCLSSTNGTIVLNNVTGGTAPYTYTWMPGATGSNSITNKGIGTYSVTIKGTGTVTTTYNFNIGYKVRWQQMYGVMSQTGDVLNAGASSTWLNTANSSNILSGSTNGWVECVMNTTNQAKLFGLTDSVGTGWNNIDFGIMINSGGAINTCNNGAQSSIGTYTLGDVLRIERTGNSIIYKKNNVAIWTSTITSTMQQSRLSIRAGVHATGTSIVNVGCSFQSANGSARLPQTLTCLTHVVTLTASTNVVSATYSWSPTNTTPTASITTVRDMGTYSLKITEPYYGCFVNSNVSISANRAKPNITHVSRLGANNDATDGSITINNVTGGTAPYTYTWMPGAVSGSAITNASIGTRTLSVKGTGTTVATYTYNIGYKTTWKNLYYGMVQNGDTLKQRRPNGVVGWQQFASSTNMLPGSTDGWVEYVVAAPLNSKLFGLMSFTNTTAVPGWTNLNYAVMLNAGSCVIYKDGGSLGAFGTYTVGDVFRVERKSNTIVISKNNVTTIWSSTITPTFVQSPLTVGAAIYDNGGNLENVGCSFFPAVNAIATLTNLTTNTKGVINLNITGGKAPYSVAWNGVKLPSNRNYYVDYKNNFPSGVMDTVTMYLKLDSLRASPLLAGIESGIYNNKVYDANNDSISFTSLVGSQLSWITSGVTTATTSNISPAKNYSFTVFYGGGNQLTQTVPGSNTSYAVTNDVFNASEREVYTSFAVSSVTTSMNIGFKTASSTNTYVVTDMASNAYIHLSGAALASGTGTMSMYFNNTLVGTSSYLVGDVMGILLDPYSRKVEFYKNAQKLNSTIVGASTILDKNLQLKLGLPTAGTVVKDLIIVGPKFNIRQISATISDVTCSSLNSGVINFNAYSIADDICSYSVAGPNGYSSSGTLLTNNVLNGLQAGVYTITIPLYNIGSNCTGAITSNMIQSFTVSYSPIWVNHAPIGFTNIDVIDKSFNITANQASPYTWLAGASSYNQLNSSDAGWAEFKPLLNTNIFYNGASSFGLNNIDLSTHPSDNDHFFYVKRIIPMITYGLGSSGFSTYYGGPYLASISSNGSAIGIPFYASPSDILRINKVSVSSGSQMKFEFYKNNAVTPITTSGIYTGSNLVADLSVNQTGIYIKKPRLSFSCPDLLQQAILKKELDADYILTYNNKLRFTIDGEYNTSTISYLIYNASRVSFSGLPIINSVYKNGDNRYEIDISSLATGFYVLEVTNQKNEKQLLRFKK